MYRPFQSGIALSVALGLVAGAAAPIICQAPAQAQMSFSDVSSSYWAAGFIQELSARGVIKGFPDGSFRPDEAVTRAQFAAMVSKAFSVAQIRGTASFSDVSTTYWGYQAIQSAYSTGFLTGYPNGTFGPNENIPRAQVLVSLANGLRYTTEGNTNTVLSIYNDADSIPTYARDSIAAATVRKMVVNYPSLNQLNPNRVATRAEVAAFIYQALNSAGQTAAIASPYIVGYNANQPLQIPAGTSIPVRYDQAQRILLAKNEPQPTPLTVTVAQNVVSNTGQVLIPAGSKVSGQLVVADNAAQFVAQQLTLSNGTQMPIDARSEKITQTETIKKGASTTTILKDTALGAAAAAGISAVTGDRTIQAWEVLSGAGAGALAGLVFGGDQVDLISIRPNTDLNLQLGSDLVLTPQ